MLKQAITTQIFYRPFSTNFTGSILEYLAPYVVIDYSKTAFKLIKYKKEIGVTPLAAISPIRYVNGCPESKILSLKYPHLQLLI